jgi:hypothetical protein
MNHMRERHLDGTVLRDKAAGGVFEPLARPDLLITDAERAAVTTSKRKDRESSLIGAFCLNSFEIIEQLIYTANRYHHYDTWVSFIGSCAVRL